MFNHHDEISSIWQSCGVMKINNLMELTIKKWTLHWFSSCFMLCNACNFRPLRRLQLCKQIKQTNSIIFMKCAIQSLVPTRSHVDWDFQSHYCGHGVLYFRLNPPMWASAFVRVRVCAFWKQFNLSTPLHSLFLSVRLCIHLSLRVNILNFFCSHGDVVSMRMGRSAGHNRAIQGMRLSVLITKQPSERLNSKVIWVDWYYGQRVTQWRFREYKNSLISSQARAKTPDRKSPIFLHLKIRQINPPTNPCSARGVPPVPLPSLPAPL